MILSHRTTVADACRRVAAAALAQQVLLVLLL
jgi:hypothetical protein